MKYIDAEKLIAEIEKRMQDNADKALLFGPAFAGRTAEDNEIINIIASLQQEQPKGLDEAANDYCSAYYDWDNEGERSAVVSTFKAGAEWMAGQFEKNHLDALRKVKALRDAQNMHEKTLNYGWLQKAKCLGKEVDEILKKLLI